MDLSVFCAANKMPFAYCWWMVKEDGSKETVVEKNNVPLEHLSTWRKDSEKKPTYHKGKKLNKIQSEKLVKGMSIFLKYSDYVCIDCDSREITTPDQLGKLLNVPEINNSMCWVPGNTKGFHIYVKIDNFDKRQEGIKVFGENMPDVDIIKYTKNVWEKVDKQFSENLITSFDMKCIEHLLVKTKKRKTILSEEDLVEDIKIGKCEELYLENCSREEHNFVRQAKVEAFLEVMVNKKHFERFSGDYEVWVKLGYILINEKVRNRHKLWLAISSQMSDKSNSTKESRLSQLDRIEENVVKNQRNTTIGFPSLLFMCDQYIGRFEKSEVLEESAMIEPIYWYEITKEWFEKTHFQFEGSLLSIKPDNALHYWPHKNAENQYKHLYFPGKTKTYFLEKWVEDAKKKQILEIVNYRDYKKELPPTVYNAFKGFEIEKHGDIYVKLEDAEFYEMQQKSWILNCINTQIADGKKDVYEYIIQWLAHTLFKSDEMGRHHSTLVLYSETEGIGKSSIFHDLFFERIIGRAFGFRTSKLEEICGKFNAILENKHFGIIEEGKRKDASNYADELKDLATSSTIVIEKKCQNKYMTNSVLHMVCLTNNENVFTVSASNRRYMLVQCREKLLPWVDELIAEIKDKDKNLQFCKYLYTMLDPNWHCETLIREKQQESELYKAARILQADSITQWAKAVVENDGLWEEARLKITEKIKFVTPMDVYVGYEHILTRIGIPNTMKLSQAKFGRECHKRGLYPKEKRQFIPDIEVFKDYLKKEGIAFIQ